MQKGKCLCNELCNCNHTEHIIKSWFIIKYFEYYLTRFGCETVKVWGKNINNK